MAQKGKQLPDGTEYFIGEMAEADFGENTLTFEMTSDYMAQAGEYVIIKKSDFDRLINKPLVLTVKQES